MKVLFVTDSPEVWGAERSLLAIAVALRDRGNEIAVMAPSRSPLLAHLQVAGVRAVVKDLPEHPALLQGGLAQAGLAKSVPGIERDLEIGKGDCSRSAPLGRSCVLLSLAKCGRAVGVEDCRGACRCGRA